MEIVSWSPRGQAVDDDDLVGRRDREAREPDQVARDHDAAAREQRLVAVADVVARRERLDDLQRERGDRGDREGAAVEPEAARLDLLADAEAVGDEVAGDARERVRQEVDVDLARCGDARVTLIVSAPAPLAPVMTTPPTQLWTPGPSVPAAKPAGISAAGRGSNAVRLGRSDVRDDQRRRWGRRRARRRGREVEVQSGLEVDAAAVLPVLEVRLPDRPQHVRSPTAGSCRRRSRTRAAATAPTSCCGSAASSMTSPVVGVDLALDAERGAVGADDADRPGDDVAGRGAVQPDPQAAAVDVEELARAVGVVRVVRIDEAGRTSGSKVRKSLRWSKSMPSMNAVAKSRWLIVKFRGGVGAVEHLVRASAAGLRKRPDPVERVRRVEVHALGDVPQPRDLDAVVAGGTATVHSV